MKIVWQYHKYNLNVVVGYFFMLGGFFAFLCLVHGVEGGEERMVGSVVPPVSQVQSAHKGGQGWPRVIPHCAYPSPSLLDILGVF